MAVGKKPFPLRFTIKDIERLLVFAARDRISLEEVRYAIDTVNAWASSNNKMKADWPATVRNAWRAGWALSGFKQQIAKQPGVKFRIRGEPMLTEITSVELMKQIQEARRRGYEEG